MHVERRDLGRPTQPQLVVVLFGDDRYQPRHPEAVGTHGQPHRLAVLAEHVDGEGVGVFAAELEDVADLDPAGGDQRPGAVGRRIAVAHLGGLNGAVGGEVAAGDQPDDVLPGLVGAGDPAGAVHHPRVDEIANTVVPQRLRADISLHQKRVLGEVGVVEQRVLGRVERRAQPLVVDLAVSG